jgi:hypothetical protein
MNGWTLKRQNKYEFREFNFHVFANHLFFFLVELEVCRLVGWVGDKLFSRIGEGYRRGNWEILIQGGVKF